MTEQEFIQRYHYSPTEDKLGAGGFGQVYKAYDTVLDREVALKMAQVIEGKENLSLLKEVELAKNLPVHANVAHYQDCFRLNFPNGTYDIGILQYYPEGSLATIIKKGQLSLDQIQDLTRGILEGLALLHGHNVMHRDMKPGNVLISKRGDKYIPKIADFGLSKQVDSFEKSSFVNSFAGGSAYYSAPEQLTGDKVRQNVDLWSFGVMLYELVTGDRPFTATMTKSETEDARLEIYGKIKRGDIPAKILSVAEPYQTIIKSCLIPDRTKRVQNTAELLSMLDGKIPRGFDPEATVVQDKPHMGGPPPIPQSLNETTSARFVSSATFSNGKKGLYQGAQARKRANNQVDGVYDQEDSYSHQETYLPEDDFIEPYEEFESSSTWPSVAKIVFGLAILGAVIMIALNYDGTDAEMNENIQKIETDMVSVDGGEFEMGCHSDRDECIADEFPVHSVLLEDFRMSKYEVTMAQWSAVMGDYPEGYWNYPDCPVVQIAWDDVQLFIAKLNELTNKNYRLPTEAEWEYAAKGGALSENYLYSGSNNLDEVAWVKATDEDVKPQVVGQLAPNELGLYDMTGNVWEWCSDYYGEDYYSVSASVDPLGPSSGTERVIRGGCLNVDFVGDDLYTSYRLSSVPSEVYLNVGFRLASD